MHIHVLGRRYAVRHVAQMRDRGQCDPPDQRGKEIRIASWLPEREHLEIAIHEFVHADDWDKFDEGYVTRFAADLSTFLWRLGYRRANATQGKTIRRATADD